MTRYVSKPKRIIWNGTPSRKYYVRAVGDDGKRTWVCTECTTAKAAQEWKITQEMREAIGDRAVSDVTFGQAADSWIRDKKLRASPQCLVVLASYRRHWDRHFHGRLRDITREDCVAYFAGRQAGLNRAPGKRGRKTPHRIPGPVSLNNERRALRQLFLFARRQAWISRSPMDAILPFREERRTPKTLAPEQADRFLEECSHAGERTYGFVLCLLRSGLRRGTVRQLTWDDIDFERGEWRIPAAKMKSREDFSTRPVAADLLEYLRERRRPAGPVFGALDAARFQAAAERAGVPWLRPHDLRRGFITVLRRQGTPMEVAMWLGDWRDVDVVVKIYREVSAAEGAVALNKAFGGRVGEA